MPPRGRGRPTLYSPELTEEFCGLIVDGLTIDQAVKQLGGPDRRTIKAWFKKYPEFRKEFEESVAFRNECWVDDNVDIAADVTGAPTADRKLLCDQRWKRYNGMGLKGLQPQAGDSAKLVGESKVSRLARAVLSASGGGRPTYTLRPLREHRTIRAIDARA